jgi:hypothetical protein
VRLGLASKVSATSRERLLARPYVWPSEADLAVACHVRTVLSRHAARPGARHEAVLRLAECRARHRV